MHLKENDSDITDSCLGCGRPHPAHQIAKISKVEDLAVILLINVISLSSRLSLLSQKLTS